MSTDKERNLLTPHMVLREVMEVTRDALKARLYERENRDVVITLTICAEEYEAHLRDSLDTFAAEVIKPALAKATISKDQS